MGIFAMKWAKKETKVNDGLLAIERAAANMAKVVGNTVTTDLHCYCC